MVSPVHALAVQPKPVPKKIFNKRIHMDDDVMDPRKTMGKPWENGDLYSNQSLVGGL